MSNKENPEFPSPWIPAVREDTHMVMDTTGRPRGEPRVIVGSCPSLEASLFVGEFICSDTLVNLER